MKSSNRMDRLKELSPAKRALLLNALRKEAVATEGTQLIPRRLQHSPVPLAYGQQRLWFLDQLAPGNTSYHLSNAVRLTGRLDITALARSFTALTQRHEALHTTFTVVDKQAVQVISAATPHRLTLIDLSGLPEADRRRAQHSLAITEPRQPFDLSRGPLLRTCLLRLDANAHVLLMSMHHIISDGWSMSILIRELVAFYEAYVTGQSPALPALSLQYPDYALWQRNWLQGAVLEQQLDYWRQQLTGAPAALELPTDRPRPSIQTFRGASYVFQLSPALDAALKELTRLADATIFMTLLAAWQALLGRYSGQDDIVVGTSIAGRERTQTEGLIGFFVNQLVLRARLSGNPSFRALLGQVREVCLSAYMHQDLPFETLVEKLQPERELNRTPLFQVMFVLQNTPSAAIRLPELTMSPLEVDYSLSKFDMTLFAYEAEEGLIGGIEYNVDLFDRSTVERLAGHFQILLEGISADPDRRLPDLPLLSALERAQLLVTWNTTRSDYPRDLAVHQQFAQQAAQTPDAVAVVFEDAGLTYHELNRRANQLAHYLCALGVGPEVIVALCMERSVGMIVSLLGILKAGGAYVSLDPSYPAERLVFLLTDSQTPVLLTEARLLNLLPATWAIVICIDSDWPMIAHQHDHNPITTIAADNLVYMIYTSGSTGTPKGVRAIHRAVMRLVKATNYALFTPDDIFLQLAPISFDASTLEVWGSLLNGGQLVVFPARTPDLAEIAQIVDRQRVTVLWLTAGLFHQMAEQHLDTLASVPQLLAGGDVLAVSHVQKVLQARQHGRLINGYGPTENTTFTCCYPMTAAAQVGLSVPIGRPIANTQVYVLDRSLQLVPIGVVGELYIGGDGLARDYHNRPDLTAERFVPNPFARVLGDGCWVLEDKAPNTQHPTPNTRLYRTGDLVRYLADGTIEFLGRTDYQVKVRGFRIELGEIEAVLNQHPAVREAVVLARKDVPGDKRLVAYVVSRQADGLPADKLRRWLREQLPESMIPSAFVELAALPLTPNGKVDRKALPAPDQARPELETAFVAPQTAAEELMARVWVEVLGLKRIGRDDNFFDAGGHSLLATQIISRVREVFQIELPLRTIFEAPTVAGLAKRVTTQQQAALGIATPPLLPVPHDGPVPLSFAQQRLWFIDQLAPGVANYIIPTALRLEGRLDVVALALSFTTLIQRHEALRTTFAEEDGRVIQVIAPAQLCPLIVVDLDAISALEQEDELLRLAAIEAQRPFNLAGDPLVRMCLLRLAAHAHVLLLTMHHIVSDGWSIGVMIRELVTLYDAAVAGRPITLPPLPIQYADYAIWQRDWLQGDVLDRQLAYWKAHLAGAPTLLELPTDRPRPPVQSFRGAVHSIQLSPTLSAALQELSLQADATLFMTLLAAFATLLHRYSGQDDLVIGSPIAGRTLRETEGLIGFFVNTLALRARLSDGLSFRALLAQVRETCLDAYAHQELPFELLVEALKLPRHLSHAPLFQVAFVLQNAPLPDLELVDLRIQPVSLPSRTAKFDLTLAMAESVEGLTGTLEYNSDLFDAGTIARMAGHFSTLLAGIAAVAEQRVAELPLLNDAERQVLLHEWNATRQPYLQDRCWHHLFEQQVERTPDAIAVVYCDAQLSYRSLNARANKLAHYLQRQGVGPEVLMGLCVERSLDLVIGVIGTLKAGGAYVPITPRYPSERIAFIFEDSQTTKLLTHTSLVDKLPITCATVVCLDGDWSQIEQMSDTNPASSVAVDHRAYVIYTSGSTGRPKGVEVTHRGLGSLMRAQIDAFSVNANSRVLQFASLSFDASVWEMTMGLLTGATLCVPAPELQLDGPALAQLLREQAITIVTLPPSVLTSLPREPLPALSTIVTGGEACSAALVARWGQGRQLFNAYGPTETTVCATIGTSRDALRDPAIGRPIANMQVYLLDRALQPTPIGVPGELHIGGVGLARGYLNRPDLTAEKFIPNPFAGDKETRRQGDKETGDATLETQNSKLKTQNLRLYRTGDLARYRADGAIEFLGRRDQQVKVRGFRIELGEVEAVLHQDPAVRECVVVAREDTPGEKRLVAYVVPKIEDRGLKIEDSTSDARDPLSSILYPLSSELRDFLKQALPDYMLPSAFVFLEALPLTPNGKIDRKALPPPESLTGARRTIVTPQTPMETLLAELWSEVLGQPQVGRDDNFFDLGGHSLLATRLITRVRESCRVDLSVRSVFEAPTVAALAARVTEQQSALWDRPPPLAPIHRDGPVPLSFGQHRLWFIDQLVPGSIGYTIFAAVQLTGRLDLLALARSFVSLAERHESLRTTFATIDGSPVQIIAPSRPPRVRLLDLAGLPSALRETAAHALAGAEARQPFDLAVGPLLRVCLQRLDPHTHVLLLTMHHIVSDGWSMGVLIRELAALYEAHVANEPDALPPLPIQYADYAIWQRAWLQGTVLDQQIAYWRTHLAGAPTVLELPTDRPRPPVQSFNGALHSFALPQSLSDNLGVLTHRQGATLFMTMLAAFVMLLSRYSGQSDLVVGSPIAGRTQREAEGLIGFFVNTLALRARLSDRLPFSELLAQVRETCLGAYAHQDLPFEMLVEALKLPRHLSHTPVFQVMFALQNTPLPALELTDLRIQPVPISSGAAKFDLTLSMNETASGLVGAFEYNTDLFDAATIARLAGHFQTLLAGVVANPVQHVAALPLLTDAEWQLVLGDWNASQAEYPQTLCIHQLFEAQAAQTPDVVAVVYEGQQLSYQTLNTRANQLAHYLRAHGVGPDVLVGLCVERSLEMIVGILGVLKAGGAYVPLDPTYPQDRLTFMLEDTQAPVLLTQAQLVALLPPLPVHLVRLDADWPMIGKMSADNPLRTVLDAHLAYVIYTSGSTGRPKGVMVRQGGLINLCWGLRAFFDDQEVHHVGLITSISFDISVNQIFPSLLFGRTLHVIPDAVKYDSRAVLPYVIARDIQLLDGVPSYFQAVLAEIAPEHISKALRYLLIGGEKLEQRLLEQVFDQIGPQVAVVNIYGLTEISDINALAVITHADMKRLITVGRPLQNNQIYIMDRNNRVLPVGIAGEICIAGDSLSRGYLNRPDLTAEKFGVCPFGDGKVMCHTGDIGRWRADGQIEVLGRRDHQIKLRGYRIEVGEIEAALAEQPGVQECVVVLREDQPGDPRLVGYVVPQEGAALSNDALWGALRTRLPDYMAPALFVQLAALPKTPNGKLDRKLLPTPDQACADGSSSVVPPRTPVETVIAGIWAELLGLNPISIDDHFFERGGHSLLATQVIARVRVALQIELPLRSLFEYPTPASLAARIEQVRYETAGRVSHALRPLARHHTIPLSFAQERLWFLDQLAPGSASYTLPSALRLLGPLDLTALARALNALVARHEAVRTTFPALDGRPHQHILPPRPLPMPVLALDLLSAAAREDVARALIAAATHQPFDLANGPLLRALLLRLDPHTHILLLTMHHIISDGWSMGVLIEELVAGYTAYRAGLPATLPPLPIQYADYALWQRATLQGTALDQQLAYWKAHLAGVPPLLALPTDYPRPPLKSPHGALHNHLLPHQLADELHHLTRQSGTTLFMTLLAAFQLLLHRYSAQDDLVVGSPIAGRTHAETERLIGFFVNTLVLRARFSTSQTFRQLLAQVRETCLGAYAHQDLPFEALVDALKIPRDLSRNPLFQVMFALQNAPRPAHQLVELLVQPVAIQSQLAKFDLTLALTETSDGLLAVFEYSTDLFDPRTITYLAEQFQTLLTAIVAHPEQRLVNFSLLNAVERDQVLCDANGITQHYPQAECLHRLVQAQAQHTPHAIAVVAPDGHLTYHELHHRAEQLAQYLRHRGVGPEVTVGLCLERSLELVLGLLGILNAGAAYVPLDPSYPVERLTFMLNDARAPLLLTHAHLATHLPTAHSALVLLDHDWHIIAQEYTTLPPGIVSLDHPAYVIYTSGSTGQPKGVVISHRAISNHMCWMQDAFPVAATDAVLQKTPFSFDAAVWEFYAPLLAGARLVLARPGGQQDSAYLSATIQAERITTLQVVPGMLRLLLDEPTFAGCTGLNHLFCGGEALATDLVARLAALLPTAHLHNLYGPTEATIDTTCWTSPSTQSPTSVAIGRPIINVQVYVLDAQLQLLPHGVPGELYIGGAGLARGYLHRPALTAEKFIPNPFAGDTETRRQGDKETGDAAPATQNSKRPEGTRTQNLRLYRTGDLARIRADGQIEFLRRIDDQVKLRGFRIELGEIEAVLVQHALVRACAVLVREDMPGDQRLVAYIVPKIEDRRLKIEDSNLGSSERLSSIFYPLSSELRAFLKQHLPDYMLPAAFVQLAALPKTPNGKLDRKALPALDTTKRPNGDAFVAPRDMLELQLVQIWEELLKVRPISVTDSFFDLGGHSLLAVALLAHIQRLVGHTLPLAALFQHTTIAQLARHLRTPTTLHGRLPLVALQPYGTRRPFFCVHAVSGSVMSYLDLARRLGPDQPVYGLQAAGLDGEQAPVTQVETLAAHYLDALRAVQQTGPYLLGGWSVGGVIAFEMARQLQQQGQTVALLALLDSVTPAAQSTVYHSIADDAALLNQFVHDVGATLGHDLAISAEQLRLRDADDQLRYVLELGNTIEAFPAAIGIAQIRTRFQVFKANLQAVARYTPHAASFRTILFQAEATAEQFSDDPTLGWGELLSTNLELIRVPGTHYSIFSSPNNRILAEQLQTYLELAQT